MIYTGNITIPKDTPSNRPVREPIIVVRGLVYKVEIEFPPGPEGTTHIVINDGGFQVWPTTPGVDFASDDYTISFDDTYLKTVSPLEFQIYGYNTDTVNNHSVQVRIGMVSEDVFIARFLPTYTYDHFMNLIRKMQKDEIEKAKLLLSKPFTWIK